MRCIKNYNPHKPYMKKNNNNNISRRSFLKIAGAGAVSSAVVLTGCKNKQTGQAVDEYKKQVEPPVGKMTMRTNPKTKEQVSLLGYGMMRLPTSKETGNSAKSDNVGDIDQEMVNRLVDYALEHGVNYFDTSPVYCNGHSERSTGIALSRHQRSDYLVATKLSNFNEEVWSREETMKMYHNSFKELQVDYIDYYLLHGIGMGGMDALNGRYIDNGILDFLVEERKAGRIRNLGFSYHGDIEVYDYLLSQHDKYHWDFVQIELNYLDWDWADEINNRNTDARYLSGELEKRGIPAVIMEPLLGGRLSNLPQYLVNEMKQRAPERSVASWAFRYAGTPKGVLTVLSGMTYMEHLTDNCDTYCHFKPLNQEELDFLEEMALLIRDFPLINCTACNYCMPCPYGIDIPGIFLSYNQAVNDGLVAESAQQSDFKRLRRRYLALYNKSVESIRQANHCINCGQCQPHCPQNIRIPREMTRIDNYVEKLKRETL